jgi:lipoprotein NlpI
MAKRISVSHKSLEKWLIKACMQLQREDYHRVIMTCQRILRAVSNNDSRRAEALGYMGTAYSMLNESSLAFDVFSQALLIKPEEFDLWYNRGVASLFTSRIGRAYKDFSKAASLCTEASYKERVLESNIYRKGRQRGLCPARS